MRKKVDNALFNTTIDIGAGKVKQIAWYITNILFFKNSLNIVSSSKVYLLRWFGAKIGRGVVIKPSVNIKYPWKLTMDDYCWIGENVWIDNLSDVVIGRSVTISQGAMLLTGSHDYTKETFDFISEKIIIEEGAWVGARAIVMGGVTMGSHSIIGVASVASRSLEPYLIYKGNPAISVKERLIN